MKTVKQVSRTPRGLAREEGITVRAFAMGPVIDQIRQNCKWADAIMVPWREWDEIKMQVEQQRSIIEECKRGPRLISSDPNVTTLAFLFRDIYPVEATVYHDEEGEITEAEWQFYETVDDEDEGDLLDAITSNFNHLFEPEPIPAF